MGRVVPPPGIEPGDRASEARPHVHCRGASPRLAARGARPFRWRGRTDASGRQPGGGRHSRRRVPADTGRSAVPPTPSADHAPASYGPAGRSRCPIPSGPSRSGESNPVLPVGSRSPHPFGFCGVGVRSPSGRIRTCVLLLPRQTGRPGCPTLGRRTAPPHTGRPRGPTGNRTLNSCLQGRCDPVSPSAREGARRGRRKGLGKDGRGAAHGLCRRPRSRADGPTASADSGMAAFGNAVSSTVKLSKNHAPTMSTGRTEFRPGTESGSPATSRGQASIRRSKTIGSGGEFRSDMTKPPIGCLPGAASVHRLTTRIPPVARARHHGRRAADRAHAARTRARRIRAESSSCSSCRSHRSVPVFLTIERPHRAAK